MMRYLAGLLLLVPLGTVAQPDTLPADLFYAAHRGTGPASVTVGAAPAELVALFPEGAEVIGALGWSGPDDDDGATALGHVDADPEALAEAYHLDPPAGWRPHVWASQLAPGGFMSTSVGRDVALCREGAEAETPVRIDVFPRPLGGAYVRVDSGGWVRVGCDGQVNDTPLGIWDGSPPRVSLADLPDLRPPPNARVFTRGSGSSGDAVDQNAVLTWAGTAAEALTHYGAQLEADGWDALAAGDRDGAASGTWTLATDDGPRTVTLTAVRTAPDTFTLRLALASYGG